MNVHDVDDLVKYGPVLAKVALPTELLGGVRTFEELAVEGTFLLDFGQLPKETLAVALWVLNNL